MTYARLRQDLIDSEEIPILQDVYGETFSMTYLFFQCEKMYQCWQPEALDCAEYNLVLISEYGVIFCAKSIDFEFFNNMEN